MRSDWRLVTRCGSGFGEYVASLPWNGYLALRRQHENRLSLYHEKWTNEWGQLTSIRTG